jgi:inner membrane transporter RhtA
MSSRSPGAPVPATGGGALSRLSAVVPPPGLLLISIISIQLGAAVAVHLFPVIGPVATVFLRVTFSAVLLLFVARHTIERSALRHAPSLALYGAILGVMNLCFYGAIARIPLGIAVAVEFIGPLGVAVATSRRPRDFAWIALAALGILLLTPEIGGTLDPIGVALAGGAGLCWAGFILMSRRMGQIMPGSSGLAIGMAVAAVVVLPVELVVGGLGALDPVLLGAALAVAVLSTALPLSLEFEALKRMSARSYGIIVTLEPVAAAVIGAALLDQAMGLQGVLAVVCVTVAALGVTLGDRRDAAALQPM